MSRHALEQLIRAAALPARAAILDVGAGTGRLAQPLLESGFRVFALEPSAGMLARLRIKAPDARALVADGAQLPFRDGIFDAVVVARLLYLTTAWKAVLDEASRVIVDGGCVLHEWGNGEADEAWTQIREELRRRFEAAGAAAPFHPGARSNDAVDPYAASIGFVHERVVSLGVGPSMTLREFIRRIVSGEFSYVWGVPDAVRLKCLPDFERWAEQTFDVDREQPIPREISWTIFRKR